MLMKSECLHVLLSAGLAATLFSTTITPANAQEPIFDEARFGVLASVDNGHHEDGVFATGMIFFDPWGHDAAQGIDKLLRPRIHLGGSLSTAGEISQVYAGFSWTADLTDRLFLEVGVGGAVHDGDLDYDDGSGPALGCRLLFHEYAAAGFKLTDNWRLTAQIEHSSHAELCDGPNDGLSRAGVMVGYKF